MPTLKIVAQKLNIEIDKGATFKPYFFALDSANNPLDLDGYGAVMQIKESYSDTVPLFNLSVADNSISIITLASYTFSAGEVINGVELTTDLVLTNVDVIQPYLSADDTSSITQDCLVYSLELIEPNLDVVKFLKGSIKLNDDGTS